MFIGNAHLQPFLSSENIASGGANGCAANFVYCILELSDVHWLRRRTKVLSQETLNRKVPIMIDTLAQFLNDIVAAFQDGLNGLVGSL